MNQERARELLQQERQRLEDALTAAATSPGDEQDADSLNADGAVDLYQGELDEGRSDDVRDAIAALIRAEERLRSGTYGISIESGDPIPDARLEAVPTAERTADEQERFDRGLPLGES
jgi:DnaK suppressor protein